MPNEINVLYVDDEPHNLHAFKAGYRRNFNVYTAQSAQEGMQILDELEGNIHVILTDQRMPGIVGTEFLENVIEKYPEPIRILVTAYAEIQDVIDAINKGKVFSYVTKPWDVEQLNNVILKAYNTFMHRKHKDEEVNYFVYKASHDIKGPLVSMKGLLDMASESVDDKPKLNNLLALLDKSVVSLETTLGDIIEFKKIDSGAIKDSVIDFKELIEDILNSNASLPQVEGLRIETIINQSFEYRNDREILKSIITNIVTNAIKYRKKRPDARVSMKLDVDNEKAMLVVDDNGMGMSESVLNKAFDMFFRGQKDVEGSGLGLYIVKKGLERIGGTIRVNSVFTEGTTMTLYLPNSKSRILKRENYLAYSVIWDNAS